MSYVDMTDEGSRFVVTLTVKEAEGEVSYCLARAEGGADFAQAYDVAFWYGADAFADDPDRFAAAFAETFDRDEARIVLAWLRERLPDCQELALERWHPFERKGTRVPRDVAPLAAFYDTSAGPEEQGWPPIDVWFYVTSARERAATMGHE